MTPTDRCCQVWGLLRVTSCYYLLWGSRNSEAAPAKFLYLFSPQHLEKKKIVSVCLSVLHRLSPFSNVSSFATLWTIARQAPLSLGFSRRECQSGLLRSSPGHFPVSGSSLHLFRCLHWQVSSLPRVPPAKHSHLRLTTDYDNVGQDFSLLKSCLFKQWQMTAVKTIICCMLILCQAMFDVFYIHLSVYPHGNSMS